MRTARAAQAAVLVLIGGAAACIHNPPDVDGKPSAPQAPNEFWTPPRHAIVRDSLPHSVVPSDIQDRVQRLTLPDVVDIALLNNPQTRASYATARAAGAGVGSAFGKYLPQINASVDASRSGTTAGAQSVATQGGGVTVGGGGGSSGSTRSLLTPQATASWLLFDFGRFGTIESARQAAFAASYTHNATLQSVILLVIQTYCNYNAAKSLRDAARETVREDSVSLAAAKDRHDAGVATISDVLQAQTTYSQAVFTLEGDEGSVQTTRGSLAVALGFPPNLPYDIAPDPPNVPIQSIAASVDSLINDAVNQRPDLQSFRAQANEAQANIMAVRGNWLPSLSLSGSASHTFTTPSTLDGTTWSAQVGLSIPIFSGFQSSYDILQAKEQAKAAAANAEYQRDLIVSQVFNSYYSLRTATAQVQSAHDLLASAKENYDVALGKYKNGVGAILDLLTAQTALATARAQDAQARWLWYSDLAQLSHDAGNLGIHGEMPLQLSTDSTSTPR